MLKNTDEELSLKREVRTFLHQIAAAGLGPDPGDVEFVNPVSEG